MTKTKGKITIVILAVLLCNLLSLTGCKDKEKDMAIEEAAAAKAELEKVKSDLTKITSERDSLKSELAAVTEARDKLQATVDQVTAEKTTDIEEQITALTEERDAALAKATDAQSMIEELKSQLDEHIEKVLDLEDENKKLQEMIDELEKKLSGEMEMPSFPEP